MKINNLTKGVIAFSVLSMLASGALVASAATDANTTSTTGTFVNGHIRGLFREDRVKPEDMTGTQKAEMTANMVVMDTKIAAVQAALTASDYNAWVAAEKAINANCPLLTKITANNFGKYVEASNLRAQADTIMKDLGISGPGMGGFGRGRGGFDASDFNGQK